MPRAVLAALCWVSPAAAREVHLTVLHTADLEGHVLSMRRRDLAGYHGGLLRCASLIVAARAEDRPVVWIDCGNLLDGSPESDLSGGRLMLEAVSALGLQVRIPGRGDLDHPAAILGERERRTRIPWVSANLGFEESGSGAGLNHVGWTRMECDGIWVAVVGVSAPGAGAGWRVEDPYMAIRRTLEEVRRFDPAVIILAAHLPVYPPPGDPGIGVADLARQFPEFDVMLGGGEGGDVRAAWVGDVLCAQAGWGGRSLGRVDLVYDTVEGVVVRRTSDLLETGPSVPEHVPLRARLGADLGRLAFELEQRIGDAATTLAGTSSRPGQSAILRLVALSLSNPSDGEILLMGKEDGGYLAAGPIRLLDVYRAAPGVRHWARLQLLPTELREVLAENAAHLRTPEFLGIEGASYRLSQPPDGEVAIDELVLEDGRLPHGRGRLNVLCPARLLNPAEPGRDTLRRVAARPRVRMELVGIDTRERVADYIRRNTPLHVRASRGVQVITERRAGE